MKTRIITAICALIILVPFLVFSDTVVFPIGLAIVSLISIFEIFRCAKLHKNLALTLPVYLLVAVFPFILRFAPQYFPPIAFIAAGLYTLYLFFLIIWSHGKLPYSDAVAMLATVLYIATAMNSLLYVRDFEAGGQYIYFLIFIGAWITDTFAYFTGLLFGKHKLIEDVSPKKTIEGSIGGILFCALFFVGFGLIVDYFFDCEANIFFLFISGIITSVISQVGDLIMSVIKRHYQIKDFGKIFPGHGGMLDRFDSILAVSLGMAAICMFASMTGLRLL